MDTEKETVQHKAEPISPSKRESTVDIEEEEVDEEEDFLKNIEDEELKKEQLSEHHQSSDSNDAPTLLKNALKSGDVKADESEEEEKKESSDKDNNDKDEQNEPHVHQRVSFFTQNNSTLHTKQYPFFISKLLPKQLFKRQINLTSFFLKHPSIRILLLQT